MKKLNDFFGWLTEQSLSFIPPIFNTKEYLQEYFSASQIFDLKTKVNYGNLQLLSDDFTTTQFLIMATVNENDYKWRTLFNTTVLEYNPIWNVDGTATTTTQYGEHTKTTNNGQRKETNVNGAGKTTENNKFSAYPFNDSTKTTTEETDSTIDTAEKTNTQTTDAVTDSEISSTHTDTITEERKGNIGVTSTQSLIEQERKVANFNFLKIVIKDIIKDITVPIWIDESED